MQTGRPRVAREQTAVGEAENTCAKRRLQHELYKVVIERMCPEQEEIFGFEKDRAIPPYGCDGRFGRNIPRAVLKTVWLVSIRDSLSSLELAENRLYPQTESVRFLLQVACR